MAVTKKNPITPCAGCGQAARQGYPYCRRCRPGRGQPVVIQGITVGQDGTVMLTKEILAAGLSRRGAYSHAQLRLLGLDPRQLRGGWKRRLIGNVVPRDNVDRFIALKNAHLS